MSGSYTNYNHYYGGEEADEDGDGFIDIEEFANLVKAEVDRWLKKSMLCVVL